MRERERERVFDRDRERETDRQKIERRVNMIRDILRARHKCITR